MIDTIYSDPNYLAHYGVKGMKWGVRRYQNYDGTLIDAKGNGRDKFGVKTAKANRNKANSEYNKAYNKSYNFSVRHPITQHLKNNKNYAKSSDLWSDTSQKAQAFRDANKAYKTAKRDAKSYNKSLLNDFYAATDRAEAKQENATSRILKEYGQEHIRSSKNSKLSAKTKKLYESEINAVWNIYVSEIDLAKAKYKKSKVTMR